MNTHQMYEQASEHWRPVMTNPVLPYAILQPTSGQQVPTNYVIAPMQHHMTPPKMNYPSEYYTS